MSCGPLYLPEFSYYPSLATDGVRIFVVTRDRFFFILDPATEQWTVGPQQNINRYRYGNAFYYDGYVYSLGGSIESKVVERVNVDTLDSWANWGGLPNPVYYGSAAARMGDVVFVAGGQTGTSYYNDEVYAYDLATGTSTLAGTIPVGAMYVSGAVVDASMYLVNGYNGDSTGTSNVQIFTPDSTGLPDNDLDGIADKYEDDDDNDGLSDLDEVNLYGTSPTNPDTDADGFTDSDEIAAGNDPLDPNDPLAPAVPSLNLAGVFAMTCLSFAGGFLLIARTRRSTAH